MRRSRQFSLLPSRLLLALLLLLLSVGSALSAQATLPSPTYEERVKSLEAKLSQALLLTKNLETNLALRIASYNELNRAYNSLLQTQQTSQLDLQELTQTISKLQGNLQSSADSLTKVISQLDQIQKLYDSLANSLALLSTKFDAYQQDSEAVIKKLNGEIFWWKVGFTTVTVGGVAALTWALVQAFGK